LQIPLNLEQCPNLFNFFFFFQKKERKKERNVGFFFVILTPIFEDLNKIKNQTDE
jgi:hypothetical protein